MAYFVRGRIEIFGNCFFAYCRDYWFSFHKIEAVGESFLYNQIGFRDDYGLNDWVFRNACNFSVP